MGTEDTGGALVRVNHGQIRKSTSLLDGISISRLLPLSCCCVLYRIAWLCRQSKVSEVIGKKGRFKLLGTGHRVCKALLCVRGADNDPIFPFSD